MSWEISSLLNNVSVTTVFLKYDNKERAGLFDRKSIGRKLIFDRLPHYLQMMQSVEMQIAEFLGTI